LRGADASQRRPAVGPWITQNSEPTGRVARISCHRVNWVPCPAVHSDLAAASSLPPADDEGPAGAVKVGLGEVERFADPQPSAPQDDDQRPQAGAVRTLAGGTQDGDDLFDRWRVSRETEAFVLWRAAAVVAGHRHRRTMMAGRVERPLG
jgi:hypothetical protein